MADSKVDESGNESYKELSPDLRPTGKFLFESANKLNWDDLSSSVVMDVGCGGSTLKLFNTIFPKFQEVIAIDNSTKGVNILKIYRKHEKIQYHVADITERSSLIEWEGKMSKITSFFCFNCLNDPRAGLANIHYLLQPGGEAIILTALKNPHYECAKNLLLKPKWDMFGHLVEKFTSLEAIRTGIRFYKTVLKDLDFEVISCVEDPGAVMFDSEEAFRASGSTKDTVIVENLPFTLREEFAEEYIQALIDRCDRSPKGELYLPLSTAKMIIRRKNL